MYLVFWRMAVPAAASAILTLTLLVALASPAAAADPYYTFHGCRYDPDSIDPISYRFFSVDSAYETAFKEAEEEWDSTSAPGYFREYSLSWDPEINVIDGYYGANGWAAKVSGGCDVPPGIYWGNEVEFKFNRTYLDNEPANHKKIAAMHELGHAYGLDHVTSGPRLMRDTTLIYTYSPLPTSDDVDGVIARYP